MPEYLEIQAADQPSQRVQLASRTAFVIRAGLKVPLPARDCPSELHLLEIDTAPDGAKVTIPSTLPGHFGLNGQTQRSALVPWGGEIFWDSLRLSFVQVAKPKQTSPIVILAVVGLLLGAGFAVADKSARHTSSKSPPEPPELTVATRSCPAGDVETASTRARLAERTGLAQREQSPFNVADALSAVGSFGEAEACYAAAARGEDAERVAALGRSWAAQLNADYAAQRLRLERALVQKRDSEALQAATELQRLLAGRSGPYVEWLAALRVELENRTRRAGS